MYEPFFGFNRRPFSTAPDPNCFYAGETVQSVLDELSTCVERGQGIALLTAPAGMGKSLVCQRLIANLKGRFATIYLGNANFPTRRSLLQAILLELGDEHSRSDEAELRHTLGKRLHGLRRQHEALLLVVDEAHLFEAELLEEIRTLADITDDGHPLVRIVLAGQLELEERLTERQFDALNQRLSAHVYLEPLTQNESAEFLCHRIDWAGGEAETVFTEDALMIVVRASGGVPRCLNQLADHSLILAFASDEQPVEEKTVRDALEDLKQLPLHWNDVSDTVSSGTFDFEESLEDDSLAVEAGEDTEPAFEEAAVAALENNELATEDSAPEPEPAESLVPSDEDFVDDLPTSTFEWPANPESTSEVEAAWDAAYDVGDQREAVAQDEPNELTTETPAVVLQDETGTAEDSLSAHDAEAMAVEHTADAAPAVIEFGAEESSDTDGELPARFETVASEGSEQEAVDDSVSEPVEQPVASSDNADDSTASDIQRSAPEDSGEFTVNASAEPTTDVVEIFVVDHYSTIEEPLSADIVWPQTAPSAGVEQLAPEDNKAPIAAETPPEQEAAVVSVEAAEYDDEPVAVTTDESTVADETEASGETPVIEFAPESEPASEESHAEAEEPLTDPVAVELSSETNAGDAAEGVLEAPEAEAVVFEFSATEEETTTTSDNDTELTETASQEEVAEADKDVEVSSLNTVYEPSSHPQSDTAFEAAASEEVSESTFEDAESVMSDFGEFGDDTAPEDAPVQEANPVRYLDSIEAMIDEVDYDSEEVGRAADDQSDRPERPAIDIESELIQNVDHSDRDVEDEIGATMLDICLDTQSAIYEMTQQLRESSEAQDVVEEQPEDESPQIADVDPSVFDVVEPEIELPDAPVPDQPANPPLASDTPQQPPQKRAFGSLFSDLRRRQG